MRGGTDLFYQLNKFEFGGRSPRPVMNDEEDEGCEFVKGQRRWWVVVALTAEAYPSQQHPVSVAATAKRAQFKKD